jgi:hypothetical protein
MVRNSVFFVLIAFLFACAEEIPMPEELEEPEEMEEEAKQDLNEIVCVFDLSQEGDDLPLFGNWEFVGFEGLETGDFFYFTCYARWAHISFYQGGFEDRVEAYDFPLYLKLSEEKWEEEENSCAGNYKLETRTHLGVLHSCFTIDEEGGIAVEVGQPYWEFENRAINFVEDKHHTDYSHALETAYSYEIESNRLYVYYDSKVYRMVFVELEEEEEFDP